MATKIDRRRCPRAGNALRAARLAARMTQRQVAGILGVTPAVVGFYETGRRRLTPAAAARFAVVIGCSPEALR